MNQILADAHCNSAGKDELGSLIGHAAKGMTRISRIAA